MKELLTYCNLLVSRGYVAPAKMEVKHHLSEAAVIDIVTSGATNAFLAKKHNVHRNTISRLKVLYREA